MQIPATLYHGSTVSNLTSLIPQRTLSKDIFIGNFVFATADKLLAVMYTAPKGYAVIMNSDYPKPYIIINARAISYVESDVPVFIYKMSGMPFKLTPHLELEVHEFVSANEVRVDLVESHESSIEAYVKNGITIYFVDDDTFKKVILVKQNKVIMDSLVPYVIHKAD